MSWSLESLEISRSTGVAVFTAGPSRVHVQTDHHRFELHAPGVCKNFPPTTLGLQGTVDAVREALHLPPSKPAAQPDLFAPSPAVTAHENAAIRQTLSCTLRSSGLAVSPQLEFAEEELSQFHHDDVPWLYSEAVLFHPYILRDISHLRAAALAATVVERGYTWPTLCHETAPTPEALAHRMEHWGALYVAPGSCARSVARTLGAWGECAPGVDLLELASIPIQRPIPSLLHLSLLADFSRAVMMDEDCAWVWNLVPVILRASEDEVRHALARVMKVLHKQDDPDDHVPLFVQMVTRAGPTSGHTLGSVAKGVVAWFASFTRATAGNGQEAGGGALLAHPKVPLPCVDGLRFIATPAQLIAEGRDMHHCAAIHMALARSGEAFLFHAERDGTRATIMVDQDGFLLEARGPCNTENEAVHWGGEAVGHWARQLRTGGIPTAWKRYNIRGDFNDVAVHGGKNA